MRRAKEARTPKFGVGGGDTNKLVVVVGEMQQHRLSTNPMFSGNMELVAREDEADADELGGVDGGGGDGHAKMVSVTNPLRENTSAHAASTFTGGSGASESESGLASKRWGAIRSKVQTRIEIRKEKTEAKKLTKSGKLITGLVDKLTNEDGSLNRKTTEFMAALQKREDGYEDCEVMERLNNELFILGKALFEMFTPGKTGQSLYIWTSVYTACNIIVFVYMAADYSWYLYVLALEGNPAHCPVESPFAGKYCLPAAYINGSSNLCGNICTSDVTPAGIKNSAIAKDFNIDETAPERALGWISNFFIPGQSSDADYVLHHFDAAYLVTWGGRFIPSINKCDQWYRWFTSIFIHHSAGHLFSNFLLFCTLAAILERKYGTWRILAVSIIAGVGGNFLSTYMDANRCLVVVGASGACYGIFGLFCADMALNYETIEHPILRTVIVVVFVLFNLIMVHSEDGVSHTSHLGGFLCGLFPSFLFLPNFHSERWEAILPLLGVVTVVMVILVLPISIYSSMKSDLVGFIGKDCEAIYQSTTC